MRLAHEAATMSKDPSTKIGAAVVKGRRVVATGFNGFPPGIADDERLHDRLSKYELIIHAEMNAILQAGRDAAGATLYVSAFGICSNCMKHAIAAGVAEVVFADEPAPDRWRDEVASAMAMAEEAGVVVRRLRA
jgi:dCMP deaminase